MNRTRHLRTDSRDSPVRAATRVSGATPPSSAQASTTRARSASDCDAVRLRDKASSDARSASDRTSGISFGLGTCQAYNLQSYSKTQDTRIISNFSRPIPFIWPTKCVPPRWSIIPAQAPPSLGHFIAG